MRVHGRGVLPWCPWRPLSDQEVGLLKRGQPIPEASLRPPDWSLPAGYPEPPGRPVRGFHRERLLNLLEPREGLLLPGVYLRGGL